MLEAEFQTNIIQLAQTLGWLIHHDDPAQTGKGAWLTRGSGNPGFPDLVLARRGRVLFLELKSDNGKPTDAQQKWLNNLPDSYLVYPRDMQWLAELLGPNSG